MEIEAEVIKKRELQFHILDFIEDGNDNDKFQSLTKFIESNNISKSKVDLDDLLHIILMISDNHRRGDNFFGKIIQILNFLLPSIQSFFSSLDIYQKFQGNRMIILYFIQNKIITLDQEIMNLIEHNNYFIFSLEMLNFNKPNPYRILFQYLYSKFTNDVTSKQDYENIINTDFELDLSTFESQCQKGENESQICQLIRQDSLNEFIDLKNKTNLKLNSKVPFSLFETNELLIQSPPRLIEYASFFGSIQIFKYLQMNKVDYDSNLMNYAIHSQNAEMIHLVEEIIQNCSNNEKRINNIFSFYISENPLIESIKCHHNEIAHYLEQSNFQEEEESCLKVALSYYNYDFLPTNFNDLFKFRENVGGEIYSDYNNKNVQYKSDIFNAFILMKKITIPSTITIINDYAFKNFQYLEEIIIPSSVTSIGMCSFQNCKSLKQLTIPSSVKSILNCCFNCCSSLEKITFLSPIESIEKNLFQGCSSLKEIVIPSSVISIKEFAFSGCSSLIKIELPSNLISIGNGAFNRCSSLKKIYIPPSCKEIGCSNHQNRFFINEYENGVFNQCSSLIEITIPSCVSTIFKHCFNECSSLEKINIENPSTSCLTSIENNAFKGCKSLKETAFLSTVKHIGNCCFEGCSSLNQIIIPKSMTNINDHCFKGCSSLKKVDFNSSSIEFIKIGAFEDCKSLTQIEIPSTVKDIDDFVFNGCSSLTKVLIHSPINSIKTGFLKGCSSLIEFKMPSSVAIIKDNAFNGCSSINKIVIPSSLTKIEANCFKGCSSLKEIIIPKSVTSIGSCSFQDCSSVTEMIIPHSVKFVESSAFKGCSSLKKINLQCLITEIEDNCFENCSSLKEITIPSSVTLIGDYSFKNCSSLTKIEFPDSLTEIGKNCFEGCSSLIIDEIPSSLTVLNEYIFKGCCSLTKIVIPSSIKLIKYSAFKQCSSLKEISIPPSVTNIEDNVFNGCTSLINFSIPSSISKISDFMFANCSSLKEIEIPSSVTEIGDFSFYKCSSLTKIFIPSSVTKISNLSFIGCSSFSNSSFPTYTIELESEKKAIKEKETIENYLKNQKEIYRAILNYLESEDDKNEDLIKLIQLFNEKNITKDRFNLIELLNMISKISESHYRTKYFISKIEKILSIYKEDIKQQLSNNKICQIFRNNQRILLSLFEKDILIMDQSVKNILLESNDNDRYQKYFEPEIKNSKDNFSAEFLKNRKIGENDNKICQIIREDLLEEFISYTESKENSINNNNLYNSYIPSSIYETNSMLFNTTYLLYSSFFGSFKIFQFILEHLINEEKNIFNQNHLNLWKYAIHSNNLNLIQLLEEEGIIPTNDYIKPDRPILHYDNYIKFSPNDVFYYAIECHHNEIAKYIQKNYKITTSYLNALKYSNFDFIDDSFMNDNDSNLLYKLCEYDFPKFAQILIETKNIKIDELEKHQIKNNSNYMRDELSDKKRIIHAAIRSSKELINYFIEEKGVNIEFDNEILMEAISKEDIELLKMILCQSNIDINLIGNGEFYIDDQYCDSISPLFLAISKQNIKIVKLLLKYPSIDVNLKVVPRGDRSTSWTALHLAILFESIPIIKLLLNQFNIDVNYIANFDETTYRFENWSKDNHFDHYFSPLHTAIELTNLEIVKLLLNHPLINVNEIEIFDTYQSKYKSSFRRVKQTALCRAIQKNNFEMVKTLLDHPNIDVNKRAVLYPDYNNGIFYENTEDEEEKENSMNEIRKSPLQFAYDCQNQEILQLLLKRDDIKKVEKKKNEEEEENINENDSTDAFTKCISKKWNC